MPAIVAYHALGNAGGARGIEDIQRIRGQHGNTIGWLRPSHDIVPIMIPTWDQCRGFLFPLQDYAGIRVVAGYLDGAVEQRLVGNYAARLDPAGGREDHLRPAIINTGR